jgi:hypothetical protein
MRYAIFADKKAPPRTTNKDISEVFSMFSPSADQPVSVEIAESGEPILLLSAEVPANDLLEIRIGTGEMDILCDGRLLGKTASLPDTLQSWLVMAEEVAVRPVNCDAPTDSTYAPVYDFRNKTGRRI